MILRVGWHFETTTYPRMPEIYYETLEMVTGSTYHPLQKSVENRGKKTKICTSTMVPN